MQSIANKAAENAQANANAAPAVAPEKALKALVKKMEPGIKKALPSVITVERYMRILESAISTNSKLAICAPETFVAALMTSAQLGLEPNTPLGLCYLIPRYNSKAKRYECQFQIGYKGLKELAFRTGLITRLETKVVCENDTFDFEFGLHANIRLKYANGKRGKPIYYYALYATSNGGYGFEVMSMEDMLHHKEEYWDSKKRIDESGKPTVGPWDTDFDEMAKKTVLKKCLKLAPLTAEFTRAISNDETIKSTISPEMDTVPADTITAEFAEEQPQE